MSYIGNEPIVSATRTVTEITATAGQTTFTANGGYTVGFIDVFVNGAQQQSTDFTATNGSTVTLASAAAIGDDIRLVSWGTFSAANVPAGSVSFTQSGTGAITRTAQSKLQERISVKDFGAVGDGIVDDTAAIQAAVDYANGNYVYLPAGIYRTTNSIKRLTSTTDSFRNGMKLIGDGRNTIIKIDADNKPVLLWDVGYTPTGTTTGTLKFTRDSEVRSLLIQQASGRVGCDGMKLTAAWNVRLENVWVEGMSGKGITIPFRSDIYATVSDYWQCFAIDIVQCRFSECTGVGVNFAGGQSPGLWSIRQSTIASNAGGGIYCTQGQFEFIDNLVVANGTFGSSNGGMFIDVVEGPQYVAKIERNEFDTNYNWHINAYRLESAIIQQNRFLSSTFDATTGGSVVTTGGYMRPATHLSLGSGSPAGYYPVNCRFERNFHRSTATSSVTVVCYATSGSLNRNVFTDNQMDTASNSSGIVRYNGSVLTAGTNKIIHDGVSLFGQPYFKATSSVVTSIPNTSVATTVRFDSLTSSGGGYSSSLDTTTGIFTAPEAGLYMFTATTGFNGSAVTGRVGFSLNGGGIRNGVCGTSGTAATPILSSSTMLVLAKGDTVKVVALQAGSAAIDTLTGVTFSEFSGYKVPNT